MSFFFNKDAVSWKAYITKSTCRVIFMDDQVDKCFARGIMQKSGPHENHLSWLLIVHN